MQNSVSAEYVSVHSYGLFPYDVESVGAYAVVGAVRG